MSASHTPGPWRVEKASDELLHGGERMQINGYPARLIWRPAGFPGYTTVAAVGQMSATDNANAYLISAAPELLEAARALLKEVWDREKDDAIRDAVALAEAAIAKAEGHTP